VKKRHLPGGKKDHKGNKKMKIKVSNDQDGCKTKVKRTEEGKQSAHSCLKPQAKICEARNQQIRKGLRSKSQK